MIVTSGQEGLLTLTIQNATLLFNTVIPNRQKGGVYWGAINLSGDTGYSKSRFRQRSSQI